MAGMLGSAAGLVLVTVLAAGVGALGGRQSYQLLTASRAPEAKTEHAGEKPGPTEVRELKPIVTNLADPNVWVRLEAAIVAEPGIKDIDRLVGAITTDAVAYLRTLSVSDIAGAQGLRHLRTDLSERASIRSDRRVREFMVETLVVQ